MKVFWFLLGLGVLVSADHDTDFEDHNLVIESLKDKQIFILKLLNHVLQPCMYEEIRDLGRNYKIENNYDKYTNVEVAKRFVRNYEIGFLPQGEIFTLHVDRQMHEVINMFHLLYYANSFTTFLKTACWMRMHLNEGMFVYALTVAVRHRPDCQGIVIPPPYEIYPYFFVRADVIQRAYLLKMKKGMIDDKLGDFYGIKKSDKNVFIIDENKYDTRTYLNENDRLRYFTEDIDLNMYYYYFHVDYPFWMNDDIMMMDKYKNRRFELTLYIYQQILARYYLERLSNDMGEIHTLSWYKPIQTGYWPWMKYHTGVELPVRYNNYVVIRDDNTNVLSLVEDYEVIIKDAVLKGFINTHEGRRLDLHKQEDVEFLGQLIYGKVDKYHSDLYKYLMILMNSVLGLNTFKSDKYFVVPTVMDHFETALRDPIFYQLQKRIIDILFLFKKKLPSYTREELYFTGVKIENVVVDKLITYFDDYFMDMTNAVYLTEEELKKTKSDMTFLVRKRRINHKPFSFNIDIVSDKTVDSVIRIFLGPKYDHMGRLLDINKNRVNFVEVDSFIYKLKTGRNQVIRKSIDMHNTIQDRMMTCDFWPKVDSATDLMSYVKKDFKNYHTGFPQRMILPKGRVGGLKMMLYVIITPLKVVENVEVGHLHDHFNFVDYRSTVLMDKMPLGFPLDREIDVSTFFTGNMKFVDVMVFHQRTECNMKARWERYVLRNYNLQFDRVQTTMTDNMNYFDDNVSTSNRKYKNIGADYYN